MTNSQCKLEDQGKANGSCATDNVTSTLHSLRLTADQDVKYSTNLVSNALSEHIRLFKSTKQADVTKKVHFHQLLDLVLGDWVTYFDDNNSPSKFKQIFQRAYGIQPQLGHFHEESFDADRHQHDLECLSRIALAIKRLDVVAQIHPLHPCSLVGVVRTLTELKNQARTLLKNQQWKLAMIRLSQAIQLDSEEPEFYSSRALCEIHLSKFQLALEDAEDAIQLDPTCHEYRHVQLEASRRLRRFNERSPIPTSDFYRLGLNHFYGKNGVTRDLSQAKHYLLLAVGTGDVEANVLLGKIYTFRRKFEKTFSYFSVAAENGSPDAQYEVGRLLAFGVGCKRDEALAEKWLLEAQRQGFQSRSHKSSQWVGEILHSSRKIVKFESENELGTNGLSVEERLKRCFSSIRLGIDQVQKLVEHAIKFDTRMPSQLDQDLEPAIDQWMPLMMKRANKGSHTAQCFFKAHQYIIEAKELFHQNQIDVAFAKLRQARRLWKYPIIDSSMLVDVAEEMHKRNVSNAEAHYLIVCSNRVQSLDSKLWLAKQSVMLQPDIPDFHYVLSQVHQSLGNFHSALEAIDRALKLQVQPDWLYTRALLLQMSNVTPNHCATDAYEKFLSCSPPDCRHVPEAHYRLSFLYYAMSNFEKSKHHLKRAIKSDSAEIRLPCFKRIDLDSCAPVGFFRRISNAKLGKSKKKTSHVHISEILCAVCSKSNPSLFCFYCQKWVCGTDGSSANNGGSQGCQVTHTVLHKSLV